MIPALLALIVVALLLIALALAWPQAVKTLFTVVFVALYLALVVAVIWGLSLWAFFGWADLPFWEAVTAANWITGAICVAGLCEGGKNHYNLMRWRNEFDSEELESDER